MTVSVLGLGAMGARMAARLLAAGHTVTVWNRSPGPTDPLRDQGAAVAGSAAAAADADLVLAMLRDDDASRAVWAAALPGLRSGAVAVEASTLTPDRAREWADDVRAASGRPLGGPVVGTRPHAEAGALTVLAGGDADTLEAARPAFDAFAGAVHHVGPVGAGMAMKVAVNAVFAAQAAVIAEVLAGLRAEGVAPDLAAETLAALPTASPAGARLGTLMAGGAVAPNFPIQLVAKDLGYARRLVGPQGRAVDGTAQAFEAAVAAGLGPLDIAGIAQLYA